MTFEKDQPWLKQPRSTRIQFVDQTPDLENHYAQDNPSEIIDFAEFEHGRSKGQEPTLTLSSAKTSSNVFHDVSSVDHGLFKSPASSLVDTVPSRPSHKRRKTNESSDVSYLFPDESEDFREYELLQSPPFLHKPFADGTLITDESSPSDSTPANQTRAVEAEYKRLADSAAAAIPTASSGLLTPEIWKKSFFWPNDVCLFPSFEILRRTDSGQWTTTQCACLMRHYVACIAPWVFPPSLFPKPTNLSSPDANIPPVRRLRPIPPFRPRRPPARATLPTPPKRHIHRIRAPPLPRLPLQDPRRGSPVSRHPIVRPHRRDSHKIPQRMHRLPHRALQGRRAHRG